MMIALLRKRIRLLEEGLNKLIFEYQDSSNRTRLLEKSESFEKDEIEPVIKLIMEGWKTAGNDPFLVKSMDELQEKFKEIKELFVGLINELREEGDK